MADKDKKSKKENQNWFMKHKVLTAIIVLIVIVAVSGSSKDTTTNGVSGQAKKAGSKTFRFADRADKQSSDVEAVIGETATVGGVKMTVTSAERKSSFSEYEKAPDGKQYLVLAVGLENTSGETHPYNVFDFKVQTAGGQVLDPTFTSQQNLGSGDLVAGGKASGNVVLEVPAESGHEYLIWKSNAFSSARAIVQVQ